MRADRKWSDADPSFRWRIPVNQLRRVTAEVTATIKNLAETLADLEAERAERDRQARKARRKGKP